MRRLALIPPVAVAAVALVGALTAAARPSEHARIVGAVRSYIATSGCCEVGRVAVAGIDVASVHAEAVGHKYAAVRLDGFDAQGEPVGSVTAVLQRELGVWRVLTLGSSDLGCGIPSAGVRAELGVACDRDGPGARKPR